MHMAGSAIIAMACTLKVLSTFWLLNPCCQ